MLQEKTKTFLVKVYDDLLGEENVDDGGYEPTTPPKSDGSDREQSSLRRG